MRFLVCIIVLASNAHAFMPNPDLLTITPAVAKAGSTVEVTIKGTNLDDTTTLRFADPRFEVEAVTLPADDFHPAPRPIANRFRVTIPDTLEAGLYEVRSLGYFGLSTARPFKVVAHDAIEIREEGDHSNQELAMPLDIETGVLATTDNRKVDWYRLMGRGGSPLTIEVWAERLDSRADCQIAVFDSTGRELASNRRAIGADPLVQFTPPTDEEYFVAVSDTLYRGNSEYFYHLRISQKPHVYFAFPPAVEPGKTAQIELFGRNLPNGTQEANHRLDGKPIESTRVKIQAPLHVTSAPGLRPPKPRVGALPGFVVEGTKVGFATASVIVEDPNAIDQPVAVPCEIAGRFDEPGDIDSFLFTAEKDRTYALEVYSDRLGVMSDPVLSVRKTGEDEKPIAENDDPPSFYGIDALDDLNANTLDSSLRFTAKEAGDYVVTLLNQSGGGSLGHLYRLAIRDPQPDFQLICGTERTKTINNDAYPAAPLLRRGGTMVFRIIALRQDGFDGNITVQAQNLPDGVIAPPLVLSGQTTEGYLTLRARDDAPRWSGPIRITGSASIGENEVTREARNGSIIWGIRVFANQRQVRSRIDEEVVLSVMDAETEPTILGPVEDKIHTVELNQTLEIPFTVRDVGPRKGSLQVEVFGFPGMRRNPPKVSIAEGVTEGKLSIAMKSSGNFKIEPGRYQFVLQGVGNALYRRNPEAANRAKAEVARLEELAKTVTEVELKAKAVAKLQAAAEKIAKQSAEVAKEKTQQFATYSLPITVEVTAPAPKE